MTILTKPELQLLVAQAIADNLKGSSAEEILADIKADPLCGQEYLENIKPVHTELGEMYKDTQIDTVTIQIDEKFISWEQARFGSYSSCSLSDIDHYAFDTLVQVAPYTVTVTKYLPLVNQTK